MLYILLPVYNRRHITEKILDCFLKQTFQDYHLVLIDDGSTDGTSEMVQKKIHSLSVIKGKGNWWWGGSLQKGFEWLKANAESKDDFVLIINDDTEFNENFLTIALNILKENPKTLLLAQCYSKDKNELLDTGVHIDWMSLSFQVTKDPKKINVLSTRGLFFRVSDFFDIGGFYPTLIPHYQSDYEFTHRAYKKGYQLLTREELFLFEDTSETGIRKELGGLLGFFKSFFSKKSNYYHPSWFFFILISCPWRWKFLNLYRISFTKRFVINPFKSILNNSLRKFKAVYPIIKNYIIRSNEGLEKFSVQKLDEMECVGQLQIKSFINVRDRFYFLQCGGYALDPMNKDKPAKKVFVVYDGKIIGKVRNCHYPKPKVVFHYRSRKLLNSGWEVFIPLVKKDCDISNYSFYSLSWDKKNIFKIQE